MVSTIIGTMILGAIIGALARLVLPGKQTSPPLVTVILGILGSLIGSLASTGSAQRRRTAASTGSSCSSPASSSPPCSSWPTPDDRQKRV